MVAGGPDATTIHYGRNDKRLAGPLGAGLLLMDAGCELHGYASDGAPRNIAGGIVLVARCDEVIY